MTSELLCCQPWSDTPPSSPWLEISFEQQSDRWSHAWFLVEPGGLRHRILSSVEGDAQTAFPPSPPLQQVHQQDLGGGRTVLGVGMAGRSHWSAAFAPVAESENALLADLACLRKSLEEGSPDCWLGSTYRLESGWWLSADGVITDGRRSVRILLPTGRTTWQQPETGVLQLTPQQISSSTTVPSCWAFQLAPVLGG